MRAFGYRQSNSDHTLFLKKQHGKITTLIVYVDDMVVTGNDPEERKALQNYLFREFEMKDLGPLKYFLGIEISRSSEGIFLSQRKYALDLLQETGMLGCQPVNTPIDESLKLCVEPNQVSTDKGRNQRLVGRLMYLAHTRPDLAYALSVVSQYMHNPREQHMNAVIRILRYLKNALGKGILFAKNVDHHSIEVYTDADWAGAVDDRRSTSGYFTFVGGNLVTWKSKKQNVVARSSAEAEFRGQYGYSYCTTPQASRGNNKKKPVTEENKGVFVWEVQNAFHKAQRSHLALYGKRDRVLVNSSQVRPSLEPCLYSENPFSSSEFKTLDAPVCLGPFSLAVAGLERVGTLGIAAAMTSFSTIITTR
ncbi:hypothetical protein VitviT2T_003927 [Vitis vinifera]|uniref:Reverse transcriptase Ty1/copia-type domain-containing protein n=1 Tax=Vitis vinifera TaxID=29760 RepID=A0ABY9BN17_VITVI|nr:hypothetical protein VitviT2T_003927 [Vitis vinifera]